MSEIGKIIKARLKELGKTQMWLAEAAGVSNTAVSNWVKHGTIARENAAMVADLLGITVDELVKGSPAPGGDRPARSDLVKLNAIERRILALFNGADDRGKLDMIASLEEIAKVSEEERRKSDAKARQAQLTLESKTHQLGVVEQLPEARRKS